MSTQPASLYAELRAAPESAAGFRENCDPPSEQFLQSIWQHQRLRRDNLLTADQERVFILHPGFLNKETGPDFQDAIVQIGNNAPVKGDIEIDLRPGYWHHHRHEGNPAYANVVLHVVWTDAGHRRGPEHVPVLALESALDSPAGELAGWLTQDPPPALPPLVEGKCKAPLSELATGELNALLNQAAMFRLQARAEQMKVRAREVGWNQVLWEGLFRALGFKHNAWPMLRLAELRKRWQRPHSSRTVITARLLGLSGLLPSDSTQSGSYLKKLWDCWWRERDEFSDVIIPARSWRLAGIRPANHPQRRLALAAHWIHQLDLPAAIRKWGRESIQSSRLPASLLKILTPTSDDFWDRHYTFRSKRLSKPVPLIGIQRSTDIAANVVLPWLWAVAREGKRDAVLNNMEQRYLVWPKTSDNAVLRRARLRLLGNRTIGLSARLAVQQGLHQIVRDYCNASDSLCQGCRFPEVVRQFQQMRGGETGAASAFS